MAWFVGERHELQGWGSRAARRLEPKWAALRAETTNAEADAAAGDADGDGNGDGDGGGEGNIRLETDSTGNIPPSLFLPSFIQDSTTLHLTQRHRSCRAMHTPTPGALAEPGAGTEPGAGAEPGAGRDWRSKEDAPNGGQPGGRQQAAAAK